MPSAFPVLAAEADNLAQPLELALEPATGVRAGGRGAAEPAHPFDRIGHRQQAFDAGQVDAQLVDQVLDEPQSLQLVAGIDAHAADRARRLHEAETLVLAERLRVHAEQARGAADEVALPRDPHGTPTEA